MKLIQACMAFVVGAVLIGVPPGKQGAMVTVTYDEHGTANIALKIEVKPKP